MTLRHQSPHAAHSARLNALAAALCALLLLVALGLLDAHRAPWWVLLAVQGALLVTTASAGIWLDRAGGGRREAWGERGPNGSRAWGQQQQWTTMRYTLPRDDDDVFWQERMHRGPKEEDKT